MSFRKFLVLTWMAALLAVSFALPTFAVTDEDAEKSVSSQDFKNFQDEKVKKFEKDNAAKIAELKADIEQAKASYETAKELTSKFAGYYTDAQLAKEKAQEAFKNGESDADEAANKVKDADNNLIIAKKQLDEAKENEAAALAELQAAQKALDDFMAPVLDAAASAAIIAEQESERGTILPKTTFSVAECENILKYVSSHSEEARESIAERKKFEIDAGFASATKLVPPFFPHDILGCAIKTGGMKFWMLPFYVRFALEFIMQIAGLLAVAAIVYGGYEYLFAGISEQSERGKEALKNGIIGLILIFSAWAIVNIVIALVT